MVMSGSELSLHKQNSRTLPATRSLEMLDVISDRPRAATLPFNNNLNPDDFYNISGDVPIFSRNIPGTFSVSYSSDKEEISFSNR